MPKCPAVDYKLGRQSLEAIGRQPSKHFLQAIGNTVVRHMSSKAVSTADLGL